MIDDYDWICSGKSWQRCWITQFFERIPTNLSQTGDCERINDQLHEVIIAELLIQNHWIIPTGLSQPTVQTFDVSWLENMWAMKATRELVATSLQPRTLEGYGLGFLTPLVVEPAWAIILYNGRAGASGWDKCDG